jgi:hypothetical protein
VKLSPHSATGNQPETATKVVKNLPYGASCGNVRRHLGKRCAYSSSSMNKIASTLFVGAALVSSHLLHAQSTITQWTFETSLPFLTDSTTITGIAAEVGTGTASGFHALPATDWSNPTGNNSAESFSSNTWSPGDYYQFQTSTLGFANISVSWDQTRSSTGPADFKLSYSTNGTDFTDVPSATWSVVASTATNIIFSDATTGPSWLASKTAVNTAYAYDLSSIGALSNAPAVYFRLVTTIATATAAAGTNRVDNFTVSSIPEPASAASLAGALSLGLLALRRRRRA